MTSKSFSVSFNKTTQKSFNSSSDLPDNVQDLIKDEDGNGIPDFADKIINNTQNHTQVDIEINGKKYTNWDQVPKEFRNFNLNPYAPDPAPVSDELRPTLPPSRASRPLFDTKTIIIILLALLSLYLIFR